jgi:hypothetical protein
MALRPISPDSTAPTPDHRIPHFSLCPNHSVTPRRRPGKYSIPIGHGPAQFNQILSATIRPASEFTIRIVADRILDVIGCEQPKRQRGVRPEGLLRITRRLCQRQSARTRLPPAGRLLSNSAACGRGGASATEWTDAYLVFPSSSALLRLSDRDSFGFVPQNQAVQYSAGGLLIFRIEPRYGADSPLRRSFSTRCWPRRGGNTVERRTVCRGWHFDRGLGEQEELPTDPQARLYKKSGSATSVLSYPGHVLSDRRCGLIAAASVTEATTRSERDAAAALIGQLSGGGRGFVWRRTRPATKQSL